CTRLLWALTKQAGDKSAPDGGHAGGNTAEGQNALIRLTSGTYNTAVGVFSLESLTGGNFNTAIGAGTLLANTADANTATGAGALLNNTTGANNTASGVFALFDNTTGNSNTATGLAALNDNIAVATLSQQRPFNQRYVSSIVRWHRIPVVLTPPIGGVNIILTFFWIDLRSVFDVTQKREPIFFWHVSRRYSLKWMIVSHRLD